MVAEIFTEVYLIPTMMIKILTFIKTWWIASTLVIGGAITVLSLSPLETLPPAPGNDKTHHFIAYALFALPAALRKPRGWIVHCLLFIAYSGMIELLQPYVNRYCEGKDLLANISGVITGVLGAMLLNALFRSEDARVNAIGN